MTVKARLTGEAADLELLAELFAEGAVRVLCDDVGYYLTSSDIDHPPTDVQFYDVARARLTELNGLARLDDPAFRPVELTGTYSDGERDRKVLSFQPARLTIRTGRPRITVTRPDGTVVPDPPSPWPDRARLAASQPVVRRVVRIMARDDDLDWYDLYKVHEIIRHDLESEELGVKGWANKIEQLGWANRTEDSAFTVSADRFDVSGDAARHAVPKHTEPPKRTMTIGEGRDYISRIVKRWIDFRAAGADLQRRLPDDPCGWRGSPE